MPGALPLLILPVVALLLAVVMPRWGFMWAMAFALYAGCKWLTYREARARGVASDRPRDARLSARVAGDGCDGVSGWDRSPCPATPIRVDRCRAQDVTRRDADLGRRPHRRAGQPASGRLDRHGRPDFRVALRHVSSAVARLAEHRRERDARHAESAALELAGGILGTTMEHGVSRARDPIHVPALATHCRPGGCHAAGVSDLGLDSRTGDLDTRARWLRAPHRIFPAPGTGSRRRAHATGAAGRPRTWLARLAVHRRRRRRPGVLAVSSAIRSKRHPADARVHRRNSEGHV